jgi:hypothetical protein
LDENSSDVAALYNQTDLWGKLYFLQDKEQQWNNCYEQSLEWMIEPKKLQCKMDSLMLGGVNEFLSCEASTCVVEEPPLCCEEEGIMKQACEEDLGGPSRGSHANLPQPGLPLQQ